MTATMGEMAFEFKGGQAEEQFTCTGCKRECAVGDDWLEIHMSGGFWGPLCLDCWHKVPAMFEHAAQQSGLPINMEAITQQIESRYQAAKARSN